MLIKYILPVIILGDRDLLIFRGVYQADLHYNYHRTYNPKTGRYIQSDPLGLAAGTNTYGYVDGNSLSGFDPLGLRTINFGLGGTKLVRFTYWTEEWLKSHSLFDSDNVLRLLSHGNPQTVHQNTPDQLAQQIISGVFHTDDGIVNDNYFQDMLKQGKDIHIKLDACDTGAYYYDPDTGLIRNPYVFYFGNKLRSEIKRLGYSSKIIIDSPNAEATFWLGDHISKPLYAPDLNGKPQLLRFEY